MLRVLDLFSGIGGFSLGLERTGGFEAVAFCEYEPFPRAVLAKHWPNVPCFPDVRTLKGSDIDGPVDVICGGYPCQPFSTAGKRRGKEDDRHLWPEFSRLVAELRPSWVIGENVAGHISMGLDDVLSDLEGQGYACRSCVITACAVAAPHRRDRVWTIAAKNDPDADIQRPHRTGIHQHREGESADGQISIFGSVREVLAGSGNATERDAKDVAHAANMQRDGGTKHREQGERQVPQSGKRGGAQFERCADLPMAAWKPEPDVGRVADGVPRRVDRLKALGNAVVPQIPEMIGHAILEAEKERP